MASKYIDVSATYNGDGTVSTQAAGSTVTITIASPGVVTWTGHALSNNDGVYLTTTGALPTGLSINTKYFARNVAANTFELALTSGGASINTSGTQSGTHTAAGVGAWNSLVAVMKGLPLNGSLAAGDNVYVRTKNTAGIGNLGEVYTAGITCATTGTKALPISFIFDTGSVWVGDSGTFTLSCATLGASLLMKNFMNFIGNNLNFVITNTSNNAAAGAYNITTATQIFHECKFSTNKTSSSIGSWWQSSNTSTLFRNCYFSIGNSWSSRPLGAFQMSGSTLTFINPTFDYQSVVAGNVSPKALFSGTINVTAGGNVNITGGSIINGDNTVQIVSGDDSTAAASIKVIAENFDVGTSTINTPFSGADGVSFDHSRVLLGAIPNTNFNFVKINNIGVCQWTAGANYPTLNALLPDGTTPWSYLVYPKNCYPALPFVFPTMTKYYTSAAATKTITVELLINNNYTTPIASDWWIDVSYVDSATGASKYNTSYAISGSLTSSTASWSGTTFGAISYTKYKIPVTTSTSIKQNSLICVRLFSTRTPGLSTDYYFVEPEFTVT